MIFEFLFGEGYIDEGSKFNRIICHKSGSHMPSRLKNTSRNSTHTKIQNDENNDVRQKFKSSKTNIHKYAACILKMLSY